MAREEHTPRSWGRRKERRQGSSATAERRDLHEPIPGATARRRAKGWLQSLLELFSVYPSKD